jgi:hypothetical protein
MEFARQCGQTVVDNAMVIGQNVIQLIVRVVPDFVSREFLFINALDSFYVLL